MGQLRTVVRAYAAEGHPPASILARANDYLARLGSERIVTALVVHLDTDGGVATAACAGHLPPLLLAPTRGGWAPAEVDLDAGPPLGIGTDWSERSTVLPPGSMLLLYTDGLVETRVWDLDEGLRMLRSALAALPPDATLAAALDTAVELVPAGLRGDDVAALAVGVPPRAAGEARASSRWLPAQPVSAPLARSWLLGLLQGWQVDDDVARRAMVVLSELVTNAVQVDDDAIRVRVSATDDGDEVEVEVFDRSHRLPYLRDAGPDDTAGRGLRIVERMAQEWGVREQLEGKTVWARLARSGK
jgi:anti-sigma regulatory factor (Ser/Thr protein kinase)